MCGAFKDPAISFGKPMISPFVGKKTIVNGKSHGLSSASYDIRLRDALVLGPHPGFMMRDLIMDWPDSYDLVSEMRERLRHAPPCYALGVALETVCIPNHVAGYLLDKSTWARVHVALYNTLLDPGFEGDLTLEIINNSDQVVEIQAGDPIGQLVFHWLDQASDKPYTNGKYSGQSGVTGARYDNGDGTWTQT
jgi:dCTP deaminase